MIQSNLKTINQKEDLSDSISKFANFDAEIAVIGCLLWDNRTYEKIADFLTEDHFTDLNNKKIYLYILYFQNIV